MITESLPHSAAQPNRRSFNRRLFRETLEIEWGSRTLTGTVRDIGPRGLFVELEMPLWMGATFLARLMLHPVIPMNCTVRRIEPRVGIGVTFDLLHDTNQARLDLLLTQLPEA
jgi:PilZ domain